VPLQRVLSVASAWTSGAAKPALVRPAGEDSLTADDGILTVTDWTVAHVNTAYYRERRRHEGRAE
jgi:hypothetical protein